jgi:general secretion pathway protein M
MKLIERYYELSRRDQVMLLVLAIALLLYLLYQAAWRPLAAANQRLAQSNAVLRESAQTTATLAAELRVLRDRGDNSANTSRESLAQLIDRTAAARQLSMSRFQPGSTGDVQIRFDGSSFDEILRWLHQLESEGVTVRDLSIVPGAAPGLVNVSVRLYRL